MPASPTIYLTANSPGEISAFLVPMVAAIRRRFPTARVVVQLLPCTFATGREEEVARSIAGVDEVLPARWIWRFVLHGLPERPHALIHLGGDLMYAGLLAWRWRIPTWAFQWAQRRWNRFIRGYFVRSPSDAQRLRKQGVSPERIHVIGDTVVDAVQAALHASPTTMGQAPNGVPEVPHIAFLPGSRTVEVAALTPFFLEVAEHLREVWPQARFSLLLSPFVQWRDAQATLAPDREFGGLSGARVRDNGTWAVVTRSGTRLSLVHASTLSEMAKSDFVVSIPGTKTGEAGSLGKPMLVVLPTNRLEHIPWHGILGLLDWLPYLGRAIKRLLLHKMFHRYVGRVYSQPNLLAESPVVPEMVGYLTPRLVADKVLEVFGHTASERIPARGRAIGPRGPLSYNGAVESGYLRIQADLHALYAPHAGAADRAVALLGDLNATAIEERPQAPAPH